MKRLSFLIRALALSCVVFVTAAFEGYENAEANIDAFCKEEWTKRGVLDTSMYNYCVYQEYESVKNIIYAKRKYKDLDWFSVAEQSLKKKWTKKGIINYSVLDYSLRQEVDAYLDIEYELDNEELVELRVEKCLKKYSDEYLNWTMTRTCLEYEWDRE